MKVSNRQVLGVMWLVVFWLFYSGVGREGFGNAADGTGLSAFENVSISLLVYSSIILLVAIVFDRKWKLVNIAVLVCYVLGFICSVSDKRTGVSASDPPSWLAHVIPAALLLGWMVFVIADLKKLVGGLGWFPGTEDK